MLERLITYIIENIKSFLGDIGFKELIKEEPWQVESAILIIFIGITTSLVTGIYKLSQIWLERKQQQRLKKDLHPYFATSDIKKATLNYVETQFQSNPPSQHSELIQAHRVTARQPLIPFFIKQAFKKDMDDQRFYIVLAGSGMGKTTFMINLYMRYIRSFSFGNPSYQIRLLPLGYPDILKKIEEIPEHENTILLLDGLDEDPIAIRNHQKRIDRILNKVKDFRVVIFTCRTQFFPSEIEEPRETGVVRFGNQKGFQTFAKMYLSPFDEKDIKRFLNKKYGKFLSGKKKKAQEIVSQSPNLMVRPMILSYIDDLLEEKIKYTYTSNLYEALIQKWIDREAQRVPTARREDFRGELYRFSKAVAIDIYNSRKHRRGLFIGQNDIRPLADRHHIQLKDMEMKSRSLLNRNVLGQYKFAHKSILEYFLAVEAVDNPSFRKHFNFDGMDQARMFYDELCIHKHSLPLFQSSAKKGYFLLANGKKKDLADVKPRELKSIQGLKIISISDASPLGPLKSLKQLWLDETDIDDLRPLSSLEKLEELYLRKTKVSDLAHLESLENLQKLYLDHTDIQTITSLKKLENLQVLSLGNTSVENLRPLFDVRGILHLNLQHSKVKDLNPIRHHHNLTHLAFQHTDVNALNPIRSLDSIEHLSMGHTPIKTLTPLQHLYQLKFLSIPHTSISSIESLGALHLLQNLNIAECAIEDIAPLQALTLLHHLNIRKTKVVDFSPLANMPQLEHLSLERTAFSDIKLLSTLSNLKEVSLRGTSVSTIKPLFKLEHLEKIHLSPQQVPDKEIKQLAEAIPKCKVESR